MKIEKFAHASPLFYSSLLYERLLVPFQDKLKKKGLTFRQSLILIGLFFEKGDVTPSDLAHSLDTSPSSISHALNHLESRRWIQRLKHLENRKMTLVRLTAAGEKKAVGIIPLFDSFQRELEKKFGEASVLKWNKRARKFIEFTADLF